MTSTTRALMIVVGATLSSLSAPRIALADDAPALWSQLGCVGCHGEGGYYKEKIKGAIGKPTDSVARWIRNAPSIKPDTPMPSFAGLLNDPQSRLLAEWVQKRAAAMP